MLYGLLVALFVVLCLLLIFIILLQKGKSSIGLGSLGGGSQLLFGGSGGQDVLEKATWVMGALFMGGSLFLALLKKPAASEILQRLEAQEMAAQKATVPVPAAQPTQPATPVAPATPAEPATGAQAVPPVAQTPTQKPAAQKQQTQAQESKQTQAQA